MKLKSSTYDY